MMQSIKRILNTNSDLVMVVLVVGVLTVLFAPIPAGMLDVLILANVSFALLVLMLTFYIERPVSLSTFPSLLLIATLFRLSLNVAATRLILSDANAGRVISAIGSFVVGGNYVIGLIVFLILVVVQYVVVTNGAQRVAEVAARFTLDSMPGQQMSIDADLNMGFIDQDEAKVRRKQLEKESGFYGAMDGASKFVKGDAIAGIIIMLINIVGGLVIGVMQMGIPWSEALRTYTLLTIGDGIVTQVPALVIAVSTGIIVTRSASDGSLSQEVVRQVTAFPKSLVLVACALFVLMFLPGIPALPIVGLICLLVGVAFAMRGGPDAEAGAAPEAAAANAESDQDAYDILKVEPIEVLAGTALAPMAAGEQSSFMQRVAATRKQFALESGMVLPRVRFRESPQLGANSYVLTVFGVEAGRGEILLDHTLAIRTHSEAHPLKGIDTREPTYGLPATWITEEMRELARSQRYTLIDPATVFLTHVSEVLKQQSAALLTRAETERLLQRVRTSQPGLVEDLIPTIVTVGDVQKVLQHLLREKVSIRNLEAILETLADAGRVYKDPVYLSELCRQKLGAAICQDLVGDKGSLNVLTLDPVIEQTLIESIRTGETAAASMAVEPKFAEQVVARLAQQSEKMMKSNLLPVVLCAPDLRRHLRLLCERAVPHLRVLSLAEVPNSLGLKAFGTVTLNEKISYA